MEYHNSTAPEYFFTGKNIFSAIIRTPLRFKIVPQKDMTGYEAWKLYELILRCGSWTGPYELSEIDEDIRKYIIVEEDV